MNNNVSKDNLNSNQPIQQDQNMNYKDPTQKKIKNTIVKILAIIGGIVVGFIILIFVIFSIVSAKSNKLICKSDEGNITIMYNDTEITGYTAYGIGFDLDEQKSYAKQVGINSYITEFSNWFSENTTGSCTIKEK